MDVGYEANESGSKHSSGVFLSYFISHSKVGLILSCSSCNFTEKKNLASISRCMLPYANLIKEGTAFLRHSHSANQFNSDPVLQGKSR